MVGIAGRELRLVSGRRELCQRGPKIELKAETSKWGRRRSNDLIRGSKISDSHDGNGGSRVDGRRVEVSKCFILVKGVKFLASSSTNAR